MVIYHFITSDQRKPQGDIKFCPNHRAISTFALTTGRYQYIAPWFGQNLISLAVLDHNPCERKHSDLKPSGPNLSIKNLAVRQQRQPNMSTREYFILFKTTQDTVTNSMIFGYGRSSWSVRGVCETHSESLIDTLIAATEPGDSESDNVTILWMLHNIWREHSNGKLSRIAWFYIW